MLTARAGQEASVEGLEAGADDYLAKPFRADELIARVRVVLERAAGRSGVLPAAGGQPDVPAGGRAPEPPVPAPPAPVVLPPAVTRPGPPAPRTPQEPASGPAAEWRLPSAASSIPVLRRHLRAWLETTGIGEEQAYDLLLAACEAATNAIEHAQQPTQPYVDVTAALGDRHVRITVRDYGQWRQRVPSMDRGRGSTLMSAFGEITATPSPEGTTVVISSEPAGRRTRTASG
jgi:anti-sigma regulatory factor (Ser/Thr protein kinase)